MPEYKGSCTGAMLDKAGEMAMRFQSIEINTAKITVPSNTRGMFNYTVQFKETHTKPKIFLQLNTGSGTPSPFLTVQPVATYIQDASFQITLMATNTPDASNVKDIPSGTYYVDYMIVDGE